MSQQARAAIEQLPSGFWSLFAVLTVSVAWGMEWLMQHAPTSSAFGRVAIPLAAGIAFGLMLPHAWRQIALFVAGSLLEPKDNGDA